MSAPRVWWSALLLTFALVADVIHTMQQHRPDAPLIKRALPSPLLTISYAIPILLLLTMLTVLAALFLLQRTPDRISSSSSSSSTALTYAIDATVSVSLLSMFHSLVDLILYAIARAAIPLFLMLGIRSIAIVASVFLIITLLERPRRSDRDGDGNENGIGNGNGSGDHHHGPRRGKSATMCVELFRFVLAIIPLWGPVLSLLVTSRLSRHSN